MSATSAFASHARHPFDRHIALSSHLEDMTLLQQEGTKAGIKALLIDMRPHLAGFDMDKIPNGLSIRFGPEGGFTPEHGLYFIQAFINVVEERTGMTRHSMGVHTGFGKDPDLEKEVLPTYVPWHFDWGGNSFIQTNFNLDRDETGTWYACDDLNQHADLFRDISNLEERRYSGRRALCRQDQDKLLKKAGVHVEQVPFGHMLVSRGKGTGMGMLHAGDTARERKTLQVRYKLG